MRKQTEINADKKTAEQPPPEGQGEETTAVEKPQPSKALSKSVSSDAAFKQMVLRAAPSMAKVAPKFLSVERLVSVALVARQRNPSLRKCSPESFLLAMMQAAAVGLEPNTPLQHAVLIPYKNKHTGQHEVEYQSMYKGLIWLASKCADVRSVRARIRYEADHFDMDEGTGRGIVHKPDVDAEDPGEVLGAYAIAELRSGGVEWDYMPRRQLDHIRAKSKAANSGPWVTDTEQMYKKTVIKRLLNSLPLDPEVAKSVNQDGSDQEVFEQLAVASNGDTGAVDKGGDLAERIRG